MKLRLWGSSSPCEHVRKAQPVPIKALWCEKPWVSEPCRCPQKPSRCALPITWGLFFCLFVFLRGSALRVRHSRLQRVLRLIASDVASFLGVNSASAHAHTPKKHVLFLASFNSHASVKAGRIHWTHRNMKMWCVMTPYVRDKLQAIKSLSSLVWFLFVLSLCLNL